MTKENVEKYKETPRRTPCLCCLLILFVIGAVGVLAVLIWFGIEKSKPSEVDDRPPSVNGKDPLQRKLEELQRHIGARPHVRREMFTNWDGTTVVPNVLIVRPTNVNEIQSVVRGARAVGLRVRCVGTAHTYSDLFTDEGQVLLETRALTTRPDGPPLELHSPIWGSNLRVVTAAAGLEQEELVQFMIRNNVQMTATSHEVGAMLGGIFSTGSRGEDIRNGPVSEKVVGARLVDSQGNLRSFNAIQHPEEMKAVRLCLGLCGVIYELSIRVTPLRIVNSTNTFPSQQEVVFNTTKLREITDLRSLQMYWSPLSSLTDEQWKEYDDTGKIPRAYDPFKDLVWLRQLEQLDNTENITVTSRYIIGEDIPQTVPGKSGMESFPNGTVGLPLRPDNSSSSWNLTMTTSAPPVTTTMEATTEAQGTGEEEEEEEQQGTGGFSLRYHMYALSYTMSSTPPSYLAYQPEAVVLTNGSTLDIIYAVQWDFLDDAEFSTTIDVLTLTLTRLADYAYKGQMPVLTMIYKWHAISPDCFLCPGDLTSNSNVSHIFSLELVGPPGDPLYWKFVNKMTEEWRLNWPTSTPNWAKFYKTIPKITQYIHTSFGESMTRFKSQLAKMKMDTNNMFTNEILREVFHYQQ